MRLKLVPNGSGLRSRATPCQESRFLAGSFLILGNGTGRLAVEVSADEDASHRPGEGALT
ncbi:MAG: hypothetical protein AAEJ65_03550 [Planctomycetota bacterium]